MTLLDLDEILTQVASMLYQGLSGQDWKEIRYVAKLSPDTKSSIYDVQALPNDGSSARKAFPDTMEGYRIIQLLKKHRRITEAMGQPWWFELRMTVFSDGRFKADFGYRDSYRPEDLTL